MMSASVSVFWSEYDMAVEILQTDRLSLRQYTIEDEGRAIPRVRRSVCAKLLPRNGGPVASAGVDRVESEELRRIRLGLWAMELKVDRRFIGDCGLTYQDVEGRRELEIGYHLLESERGKGYATEAARHCLDFGFSRTPRDSICSIVRPSNHASCAVAMRIHAARREFIRQGQVALLFYTLRQDWEALRTKR